MFIFQLFSNRIELFPQFVSCELIRNMRRYHTETILFPLYIFRSKKKPLKHFLQNKFDFHNLVNYTYNLYVYILYVYHMHCSFSARISVSKSDLL